MLRVWILSLGLKDKKQAPCMPQAFSSLDVVVRSCLCRRSHSYTAFLLFRDSKYVYYVNGPATSKLEETLGKCAGIG